MAGRMSDESFARIQEIVKRAFDEAEPHVRAYYEEVGPVADEQVGGVIAQTLVNCIVGEAQERMGSAIAATGACAMGIGAVAGVCFQDGNAELGHAVLSQAIGCMMSFAQDLAGTGVGAMEPQGHA